MEVKETLVQQGKNVISSMKDLNRLAHKEGRDRFEQFEKFNANKHSFQIYAHIDAATSQLDEMQQFLSNLKQFAACFNNIRYNVEGEVDFALVEKSYQPTLEAYNALVNALGYEKEIINVKRF